MASSYLPEGSQDGFCVRGIQQQRTCSGGGRRNTTGEVDCGFNKPDEAEAASSLEVQRVSTAGERLVLQGLHCQQWKPKQVVGWPSLHIDVDIATGSRSGSKCRSLHKLARSVAA